MLSGLALSFLAWFGLFHANPKRSSYNGLSNSKQRSRLTRLAASAFFLLALLPCAATIGLERGIALWLVATVCSGTIFMFTIHIAPKAIAYLGGLSLVIIPITAALAMVGAAN